MSTMKWGFETHAQWFSGMSTPWPCTRIPEINQRRREDFKAGLKALNASNNGPSPATDDQLEILCDFIDADKDGNIDYQEFLNAFSTKGKSGSSRPTSSQGTPK
jgi:hypothetical protein